MTPDERQQVSELFDRLARLESAPRDAKAERAIADGLKRAPHAIYPLVQTVLVQDEALRRADARIRELSGEEEREGGGFLDNMRNAQAHDPEKWEPVFGKDHAPNDQTPGRPAQTSVPSVRPGEPDPRWNSGGTNAASAPAQGSSFLGTAAASAAGVIGGALLLNSISSMFGHRSGAYSAEAPGSASASPWGDSAANSDLARDAGVNDIGRGSTPAGQSAGLLGADDADDSDVADLGGDFGGDDGGGDSA